MTKTLITAAFVLISFFFSCTAEAQNGEYNMEASMTVGSTTLSLGAGPGIYYNYFNSFSVGIKTALEFGLWRAGPGVITLGGELGGTNAEIGANFILAGRSAWHYGWHVRGLDTYGGISLGVRWHLDDSKVYSTDGQNDNKIYPAVGGFVGASYFLNRHLGFNVEAGYDISIIQAGIIFKLR
ncbi:MAG: hypothetical protein ACHQD7_13460 [Chitinophagales bacterium]